MTLAVDDLTGRFSSGEFPTTDPVRFDEIERRHERVAHLLNTRGYDGLLLQRPANFAWFTVGGDCARGNSAETSAALFITREARVVLASNIDSGQLFDYQLPGLGFQLKERPWQEPRQVLMSDLCRGRKVASDTAFERTVELNGELTGLRLPLSELECERLRVLGRLVAHALEATGRALLPNRTEAEVAGELSHRLLKHQVFPEQVQVWADAQGMRYRHWSFGSDSVRRTCMLAAVGSRWGLRVMAARTVTFGPTDPAFIQAFQCASMVKATGVYFSQTEWTLGDAFDRVRRMYEKFDAPNEWRTADQGAVIGYERSEVPIVPNSPYRLQPKTAIEWHPSLGPSQVGDTILINSDGFEILTPTENWPTMEIAVKGSLISVPGILNRALPAPA